MAIKNPPPVSQFLPSLAKSEQQLSEVAELNDFLFLIWNSLGGGSDLVEETAAAVNSADSRKSYKVTQVSKALDRCFAELKTNSIKFTRQQKEIDSLKALLSTERRKTRLLEQKLKSFIASVETDG